MLSNDAPVLADYKAVGIGMQLDRTPNRARSHRVFVVIEAHQTSLRDRYRHYVESIEPAGMRGSESWTAHQTKIQLHASSEATPAGSGSASRMPSILTDSAMAPASETTVPVMSRPPKIS